MLSSLQNRIFEKAQQRSARVPRPRPVPSWLSYRIAYLIYILSPFAPKALTIVSKYHIGSSDPDLPSGLPVARRQLSRHRSLCSSSRYSRTSLFLLAVWPVLLNKVINAPTLGEMREGKEVLANEIGVVFKPKSKSPRAAWAVSGR